MSNVRETRLITKTGGVLENAAAKFGDRKQDKRYRYCIMIMVPDRNPAKFWLSIPEGFHAVITHHGQFIGIWDSGFHLAFPWQRVSHLVTKQFVVYDTPVQECPTVDNVMVEIDVSLVFSVMDGEENVKKFVYNLGPERLNDMLKAFQEEAVRGMARQKKYSDIYDLMDTGELPQFVEKEDDLPVGELQAEEVTYDDDDDDGDGGKPAPKQENKEEKGNGETLRDQLDNTKAELNGKLKEYGLLVHSITITSVRLPPDFCNQMEEATTFHSKNIEQESKQKYDLMVIENVEGRNKAMQQLEEAKEELIVKKDQRAAQEQKITNVYQAETDSIIAVIEEDMKAEVRDVKADSELKVAQLNAEKKKELAAIAADGEAEIQAINAEMEGYIIETQAKAELQVAKLDAERAIILAGAEKKISAAMASKRDFDAKMSNLLVVNKLSNNKDCVVIGAGAKDKDSTIAQLVGAKNAGIALNLQ